MEKGLPTPAPFVQRRRRRTGIPLLRVLSLVSLIAVGTYVTILSNLPSPKSTSSIPINVAEILDKCANLNATPGPPKDFYSRSQSDRFEQGTKSVLIKNAKIWTGGKNGTEVIERGDVLIDKGIIKAIGRIDESRVLEEYGFVEKVDANGAWLSPGIVDLHSHLGVDSSPPLQGASDTNSRKGLVQPWLRSLDGLNTHDDAYRLSVSGGVTTAVVLPGSANSVGGQAFVIKLRPTSEKSPSSMLLEPPFSFNGSGIEPFNPPRWRQLKQACGENPSRVYSGTRMDNIWSFRQGYETARKIKVQQDDFCSAALSGDWGTIGGSTAKFPEDLQWEALVDVLRGRVKIQNHCYEAVDLDGIIRLTNEFGFKIAAFHHAHETYLVPELLKKMFGGEPPAVALFSTNGRYKREAYRGSEFAPKVLAQNGLAVVMKSDHPVLDSRYLLHEAQQAHYFGFPDNLALAAVTTTPAKVMGQDHRIGYVKEGYDADLVLWDSHPLSLGATPKQVFIDGIAQLEHPHVISDKPLKSQKAPETPDWEEEAKAAVKWDGLPPLGPKESFRTGSDGQVVMFVNVGSMYVRSGGRVVQVFEDEAERNLDEKGTANGVVLIRDGEMICSSLIGKECLEKLERLKETAEVQVKVVDLEGGSLAPGLVSYGSALGLTHIAGESSTNDGAVINPLTGNVPSILGESVVRAVDGLMFESRNALLAYRSGVTSAITAPVSSGFLSGLSTAFSTGAPHGLAEGAILKETAALHASVSMSASGASVGTQVGALRKVLLGEKKGELGKAVQRILDGEIPLVVTVNSADIMASLIHLKKEVEDTLDEGTKIRMTFEKAAEAHLVAKEIGEAGVGVVVSPVRAFPKAWEQRRILAGPPLTEDTAITKLLQHNVTVGIGALDTWDVRNARFDAAWISLDSSGLISKADALSLASTNLEKLLGTEGEGENTDWVATRGGSLLDYEAKVAGVVSSRRGVVDLF
ncbi:composite domain of metallo-dependent hydrolase [Dendrothele bispora CBS 962.96]|uniref:Composite domain of metallo-dependent hydrolase n=1 Tax=Dendrothele bispora (strain CBS 962.96) TaxID=1314807 RepID=A0A4S8LRU6_DENBC|nr:composite domain of metallo-dependent hydrolase [Dendrothele bispora CBS 962.96]